jgi:6-pyruvoyl-tetrahydropterin synthase
MWPSLSKALTTGMPSITLGHNIEVAHRMFDMQGKCQQIHGHSMWVDMHLFGELNREGVLGGLEFGAVKKRFRAYLDGQYDHHLLLNERDPFAQMLRTMPGDRPLPGERLLETDVHYTRLPGLQAMPADPTTENIAKWIAEWAVEEWQLPTQITVHETKVNAATHYLEPFVIRNLHGTSAFIGGDNAR